MAPSWILGLLLGLLGLVAILAEFIAPYHWSTQHRQYINLPPMPIHFFDSQGRFHWPPFVYRMERDTSAVGYRYVEDRQQPLTIQFFVQGDSYRLLGITACSRHLFGIQNSLPGERPLPAGRAFPRSEHARGVHSQTDSSAADDQQGTTLHLLGTDYLGRDVFSRLIYGSRVTLLIALSSLIVSLMLGLMVGGASGYFGGLVDVIFMRLGELVQSVPAIFLILALRAAWPLEISFGETLTMLVGIFAVVSWPEVSRLVRANVLSLTTQEFVLSAKAVGAPDGWIIWRHILPHALTPAIVQTTVIVPSFILGEAALSFLGVGIQEPHPSWGNMLAAAQDLTVLLNSWWMLTPGLAIFITVAMLTALGDAIQDTLDPRWRGHSQGYQLQ